MPPLGLKSCCINVVCCDALSLFHISQAEESVREPPNPSICWYWVVASTVTTRPLEIPPLANETLGCGCSSLVLSPVVSTICTGSAGRGLCIVRAGTAAHKKAGGAYQRNGDKSGDVARAVSNVCSNIPSNFG